VRVWPREGGFQVTAQAQLEGFAGVGVIHLAGYGRLVEKPIQPGEELDRFKKTLETDLNPILQSKFAQAHLRFVLPTSDE
jgi:hypothetical protein